MDKLHKIIIINLDERKDRWFFCKNQIKKYGLHNVERLSAVKNSIGSIGCNLSHIKALELLLKEKCKAILQPSGSINDQKIINYATIKNTSLYFIKNRVFKH